jgi:hypothetical protein
MPGPFFSLSFRKSNMGAITRACGRSRLSNDSEKTEFKKHSSVFIHCLVDEQAMIIILWSIFRLITLM